ncbi:MAG: AAA family ATPase [Spirochaetaceae bacterium]|nr:AAA family ATPase [Spirochaetaceae bacterium]
MINHVAFLKNKLYIDLLDNDMEEMYSLRPQLLMEQANTLSRGDWIIIDEVQKIPKLLDHVHKIIEEKGINFALTGSSSRKLKVVF